MTKTVFMLALVMLLGGCVHLQDFNPFHKEEPPPPVAQAPVEKIGPDVIAVPVEPVQVENMMTAEPAVVP